MAGAKNVWETIKPLYIDTEIGPLFQEVETELSTFPVEKFTESEELTEEYCQEARIRLRKKLKRTNFSLPRITRVPALVAWEALVELDRIEGEFL